MRKYLSVLLSIVLIFLPISSWADSKLSALSNNASPTTSDLTYDVASGTSYNITLSQILGLAIGSQSNGDMCTSNGTLISCMTAVPHQTPWTSSINGGGYSLSSVLNISTTGTLSLASGEITTDTNGDIIAQGYVQGNSIAHSSPAFLYPDGTTMVGSSGSFQMDAGGSFTDSVSNTGSNGQLLQNVGGIPEWTFSGTTNSANLYLSSVAGGAGT